MSFIPGSLIDILPPGSESLPNPRSQSFLLPCSPVGLNLFAWSTDYSSFDSCEQSDTSSQKSWDEPICDGVKVIKNI